MQSINEVVELSATGTPNRATPELESSLEVDDWKRVQSRNGVVKLSATGTTNRANRKLEFYSKWCRKRLQFWSCATRRNFGFPGTTQTVSPYVLDHVSFGKAIHDSQEIKTHIFTFAGKSALRSMLIKDLFLRNKVDVLFYKPTKRYIDRFKI